MNGNSSYAGTSTLVKEGLIVRETKDNKTTFRVATPEETVAAAKDAEPVTKVKRTVFKEKMAQAKTSRKVKIQLNHIIQENTLGEIQELLQGLRQAVAGRFGFKS